MINVTSLGIMSGTSLDGVDLALCRFEEKAVRQGGPDQPGGNESWKYEIVEAVTIPYPENWKSKLSTTHQLNAADILLLHNEYGNYLGNLALRFLNKSAQLVHLLADQFPSIISSHGHTIFHQPDKRFTFQLGNGAVIAAVTNITTISDFRSLDVAFGGQGAPLVPIGDKLLFGEYDYCLNLGGIANISFDKDNKRLAYDICPVNQVLNKLASLKNEPFDKDGELGASGRVNKNLLKALDSLSYYSRKYPKSLGREWIAQYIHPLLAASSIPLEDQSATFYEHIAHQVSKAVVSKGSMLVTGGGAKNKFLLKKLKEKVPCEIVVPAEQLIDFKEALIFAFLGVLRFTGQINCLASVTGAKKDNAGGTISLII